MPPGRHKTPPDPNELPEPDIRAFSLRSLRISAFQLSAFQRFPTPRLPPRIALLHYTSLDRDFPNFWANPLQVQ